ncbi:AAA family ATPase [Candidatus Mycobacterium wuenschmannii]|uniref:AAA family ATPase n=1 Tax=Candidatus Mycobacterium wuenschmannii TaxID=3027808 RepID=UPI0036F279B9
MKLSLTRKEDWEAFVYATDRNEPERLSCREIGALSTKALAQYNKRRRVWHANLGPFDTPQCTLLHEQLWDILDSNLQDGQKVRIAIAVDAFPGLGKTTAMLELAKAFHLREIDAEGPRTDDGDERWPVCWLPLTGRPTLLGLNRSMLFFYAHPGSRRGQSDDFLERALDVMKRCETRLLVIDDLHFLRFPSTNSIELSNHFKRIANTFNLTIIFVGVGLAESGLLTEGRPPDTGLEVIDHKRSSGDRKLRSAVPSQTARRTTPFTMNPFLVNSQEGRRNWRNLLLAIEKKLVLANTGRGMLADALPDYLYERSTGHIGSLMSLINVGCSRAIRTGREELTRELLESVKIDGAAEAARKQVAAAIRNGDLRARMT